MLCYQSQKEKNSTTMFSGTKCYKGIKPEREKKIFKAVSEILETQLIFFECLKLQL